MNEKYTIERIKEILGKVPKFTPECKACSGNGVGVFSSKFNEPLDACYNCNGESRILTLPTTNDAEAILIKLRLTVIGLRLGYHMSQIDNEPPYLCLDNPELEGVEPGDRVHATLAGLAWAVVNLGSEKVGEVVG